MDERHWRLVSIIFIVGVIVATVAGERDASAHLLVLALLSRIAGKVGA